MSTPPVSVLMSVHNGERYLREAIESVLGQTHRDFEFIVVDDASTDSSRSIIESYRDDRIRLLTNPENLGLTKSLNRGLNVARGAWVARQDADDASWPARLQQQLQWFDANPDAVLLGGQARLVNDAGRPLRVKMYKPVTDLGIRWQSVFSNPFIHSTTMFRRDAICDAGGYDESFFFNQDFELWTRIIGRYRCGNLRETVADYRVHRESIAGRRDAGALPSRIANVDRNRSVQRRNVLRETGSEELSNDWPELWTAINLPWLTTAPAAPRRAIAMVDTLWERFREMHRDAIATEEIRAVRAGAFVTIAMYLTQRDRLGSWNAMRRALTDSWFIARDALGRWFVRIVTTPKLFSGLQLLVEKR